MVYVRWKPTRQQMPREEDPEAGLIPNPAQHYLLSKACDLSGENRGGAGAKGGSVGNDPSATISVPSMIKRIENRIQNYGMSSKFDQLRRLGD